MDNDSKREKHPTLKAILLLAIGAFINNISTIIFHQGWPIVIHVNGFQLSIGIALANTLFVLIMMVLSFYLGVFYPIHFLLRAFFRSKGPVPLIFRIARWFFFPLELFFLLRERFTPVEPKLEVNPEVDAAVKRVLEQLEQKKEPLKQRKEQ